MITFGIITDGKEPYGVKAAEASIKLQKTPGIQEIIICGKSDLFSAYDMYEVYGAEIIIAPELAEAGKLGAMRNAICEVAKSDTIIIMDDDMILLDDFYTGLQKFGDDFDVMSVSIMNTDGSRFWDHCECVNGTSRLLGADEQSDNLYVTGGLIVLKKYVHDAVQWSNTKGFYEGEDVDFSERVRAAGFTIKHNPHSHAIHNDRRYRQSGEGVTRLDNG